MIRPNEGTYPHWLEEALGFSLDEIEREYYKNTASRLLAEFSDSRFWQRVTSDLPDLHATYQHDTGFGLLAHPDQDPAVVKKPWDSVVLKSYRRNVLNNPNFPDPPSRGWTTPENWFETIDDILRTTIVVRYLDCVGLVQEMLAAAAAASDATLAVDYEAREEGYYAVHITATCLLTAANKAWEAQKIRVPVEIQICTQVQEVLRALTHKLYEVNRRAPRPTDTKWQWDCHSVEFVPNYLGHILHYADGMIMNVRHARERA